MGVTLERVQFKFASIIGELCSEPDVLSQFAVWVDLRLAEYKLKGSISLDCSGETPDPIWLQGILSALLAKRLASGKSAMLISSQDVGARDASMGDMPKRNIVRLRTPVRISRSHPPPARTGQTETSLSKVVVKGEPEEEKSKPISFYDHDYSGESQRRKRTAPETVSCESPKKERIETIPSSSSDTSASFVDEFDAGTHQEVEDSITSLGCGSGLLGITPQASVTEPVLGGTDLTPSPGSPSLGSKDQPYNRGNTDMDLAAIRQRKALYKLRSYVTKFDRWVKAEYNEARLMEAIPPEHLDPYLAEFFTTLKTDRGGEYGYDSLITLRSGLEQYLQQRGYPHLIRSSPLFCHSQAAVRERRIKQAQERQKLFHVTNNHNEH